MPLPVKIGLVCVVFLSRIAPATSQTTTAGSQLELTDSIFTLIKQNSVHRQTVGWDTLQMRFEQYRDTATNPFTAFRWLFKQLGDSHSSVRYQKRTYRNARSKPVGREKEFEYLVRRENYNRFRVERLDEKYGYVLVPGVSLEEAEIVKFIAAFRDSICTKIHKPVKGWIIDLRTNGGGNTFPMVTVLDFLLPEGPFATVRGPGGETLETWRVKAGDTYIDEERVTFNGESCRKKDLTTPVALLTSPVTVSAGEMVLVAFKGRNNTVSIGDTTGGLVSSNEWIEIGEQTVLNISTGYAADRTGYSHTKAFPPEIVITNGYNLEHLAEDTHVRAAISWLNSYLKKRKR